MTTIAPDFVPRAALFVKPGGEVIPPPSVVQRLKAFSPRLGVRWMTGAHIPYWALTEVWPAGDPRWEQVQTGRVPEHMAFDIAHMFPLSVTSEDMNAYVETRYGERNRVTGGEAAKEAAQIAEDALQDQQDTMEGNVARVTQQSLERHERESRHALRVRAGSEKANTQIVVP